MTPLFAVTALWVIVKVPTVCPAATVIELGTAATLASALVRVTSAPPDAAGTSKVIVPVTTVAEPPFTDLGVNAKDLIRAVRTSIVADLEILPSVTVNVCVPVVGTA